MMRQSVTEREHVGGYSPPGRQGGERGKDTGNSESRVTLASLWRPRRKLIHT